MSNKCRLLYLSVLTIPVILAFLFPLRDAHADDYVYSDGSANIYQISPMELRYKPVTKEVSSSGVYSGGTAKRVTLSEADFRSVSLLLDAAMDDKAAHTGKRVMMSGAISRKTGAAHTEVILSPQAGIKRRIEDKLAELLKRGG